MAEVDIVNLISGLGVNAPLAWICWSLFQKLQNAQDRERERLAEQLELFQKIALKAGEAE